MSNCGCNPQKSKEGTSVFVIFPKYRPRFLLDSDREISWVWWILSLYYQQIPFLSPTPNHIWKMSPTPNHVWTTSPIDLPPCASRVTSICWLCNWLLLVSVDDRQWRRWWTADPSPLIILVDCGHNTHLVTSFLGCSQLCSVSWEPFYTFSCCLPLNLYHFYYILLKWQLQVGCADTGTPWVYTAA